MKRCLVVWLISAFNLLPLAAGAEASVRDNDGKIPLSLPLMSLP